MLDYLSIFLLNTPARVLLLALATGIVGGFFGWRRVSARAGAAWTHVATRAARSGRDAYRAPLRTASIERTPLLVPATAFTSYALYVGHAGCLLVFVEEAVRANSNLAVLAICLFGVGVATAHGASVLVTRGAADFLAVRRRTVVSATLVLLIHGAIALTLAAVMMGSFDSLSFEVRGLKGTTAIMTLGEIRERLHAWPILLSTRGHSLVTWFALGFGALAYACASLVNAALLLALVRAAHDSPEGPGAAAPLQSNDERAQSSPRLPSAQ